MPGWIDTILSLSLQKLEPDSVKWVLSTLAQTSAALVAFVGALGIFRLSQLQAKRSALDQEMRRFLVQAAQVTQARRDLVSNAHAQELLRKLANEEGPCCSMSKEIIASVEKTGRDEKRTRRFLLAFGVFNLFLVFVSIAGMSMVSWLADQRWFRIFIVLAGFSASVGAAFILAQVLGWVHALQSWWQRLFRRSQGARNTDSQPRPGTIQWGEVLNLPATVIGFAGAVLPARGVLFSDAGVIAEQVKTKVDFNKHLLIGLAGQRGDYIVGVLLILVAFLLQVVTLTIHWKPRVKSQLRCKNVQA